MRCVEEEKRAAEKEEREILEAQLNAKAKRKSKSKLTEPKPEGLHCTARSGSVFGCLELYYVFGRESFVAIPLEDTPPKYPLSPSFAAATQDPPAPPALPSASKPSAAEPQTKVKAEPAWYGVVKKEGDLSAAAQQQHTASSSSSAAAAAAGAGGGGSALAASQAGAGGGGELDYTPPAATFSGNVLLPATALCSNSIFKCTVCTDAPAPSSAEKPPGWSSKFLEPGFTIPCTFVFHTPTQRHFLSTSLIPPLCSDDPRVDRSKEFLACQVSSGGFVNHNAVITKELERLEEIYRGTHTLVLVAVCCFHSPHFPSNVCSLW